MMMYLNKSNHALDKMINYMQMIKRDCTKSLADMKKIKSISNAKYDPLEQRISYFSSMITYTTQYIPEA